MLEAVEDAVACAAARFKPRLAASTRGPAKGFSAGTAAAASAPNLHVEIPTADTSPASVAQLGLDTATALVKSLGGPAKPLLLVFATPDAAAAADASSAKPAGCRVMELRQACRAPALASQLVVVVAPTVSDVALCQQLVCETWTGRGVLLVNAGFLSGSPAALGLPADLTSFADQVLTVYCLMPVAVKGLLGNKDGLILRRAGPPGKDDGLWRILMRGPGRGEEHFQVGQSKRRPSLDDVQLAFINANAAASPLTKLVSQFKKK